MLNSKLSKTIQTCKKFNVKTKVHGTDYLPDESLQWFPKLGIDAANIAPEFGTIESTALVNILIANELCELKEKFLDMSYSSKKWTKWVSKDHTLNKNEPRTVLRIIDWGQVSYWLAQLRMVSSLVCGP